MMLSSPPASFTAGRSSIVRGYCRPANRSPELNRSLLITAIKMAANGNLTNLLFVTPDYYEERPKGCMGGWGSIFLNVTPEGTALPCHSARQLPVEFPSVLEQSPESIWYDSFGFNRYRGFDWMPEPCRSCDEKEKDFGGCRCQAFMLTGNADNADPVCSKSPHHHKNPRSAARSGL